MHQKLIQRQVTLVSYGTQYLRDKNALGDWYRHGIFSNARLQFRALADNVLLADDFTLWLGILKASGATRLSLHLAAEFELAVSQALNGGSYALVVHFPDHHQVWAVGEEQAAWLTHPLVPSEEGQGYPVFPDAAYYGGPIDSYWCIEDRPGQLDLPDTDWKQLARAIAEDLASPVPSSLAPGGPYFGPISQIDDEKLPLFPSSGFTSLAHRIMATLARQQSTFSNDTNPRNDSSTYAFLDQEEADKVTDWGRRLDSWMLEVQLRCANESRSAGLTGTSTPLARLHTAPPANRSAANEGESADGLVSQAQEDTSLSTTGGKFARLATLFIKIALGSLVIATIANLLAFYPWLSVPAVALWMLYRRAQRRD